MRKREIGPIVAWGGALVPLLLWGLAEGLDVGSIASARHGFRILGQVAGLVGMALLSISFILASRVTFLEDFFGGLDKMYRVHHQMGVWAFSLLLVHPLALALRLVPDQMNRALLFLLPTHHQVGVNLGVYAFWGFLLLMVLTLLIRIPYDTWKVSHKFLGLVLVLGTFHMLTAGLGPPNRAATMQDPLLRSYMLGLAGLGIVSAAYKTLVLPWFSRRHRYAVEQVRRLNEEVLEVELAPRHHPIRYTPGQFAFVSFDGSGLTRESHPFTLCSVPREDTVKLSVKTLGDFTQTLYRQLQAGTQATLEGPYGRFDYRHGTYRQIWIAGGVGVAPFLSWARDLDHRRDTRYDVAFYYCVHSRGDAVYHEEFAAVSQRLDTLRVVLVCSVERGRLKASDLQDLDGRDVFMCGPSRLTSDMQKQLRQLGVPKGRIHFEDFEFHKSV